jgi:hypothetical protein
MPKYPADKIKTLPDAVQDNFYSAEIADRYVKAIFPALEAGELTPVKDLVMDVYYKVILPEDFPGALAAIVKDPAKAKEVALLILGYDLLPIADYLGEDIIAIIEKNGGDPLMFRRSVPVRDVVERVVGKAALALEERLESRLDNILRSFVVGARKDEQMLEMLKGNAKTSGLGLDEDKALTVLALVKAEKDLLEKRGVDIVPDQVYDAAQASDTAEAEVAEEEVSTDGEPPSEPLPQEELEAIIADLPEEDVHELSKAVRTQQAPAAPPVAKKASYTADAFSADDEEEIVILQKKLPEKTDVRVVGQVTTLEDGLAHEIVQIAEVHLPNDDIEKRFLYAVKLYIRDIRDALETKSKLTMPVTGGGIGMTEAEAVRVMALLGTRIADLRAVMAGRSQKAKEAHVSAGVERQVKGSDAIEQAEQGKRDTLYQTLTGKTPQQAAAKEQNVAVLNERKPVQQRTITVIPVVGKDEPVAKTPDLSKLSVPVVHEVGSHTVAPAAAAVVAKAPPTLSVRGDVPVPVAISSPPPQAPAMAPSIPQKRTAPPPDALPVVDDDDDEMVVVHEISDSIDLNEKERAGSIPTSPAPARPDALASIMPTPVIASGSYPTPKQSLSRQGIQEIATASLAPRNDVQSPVVAPAPVMPPKPVMMPPPAPPLRPTPVVPPAPSKPAQPILTAPSPAPQLPRSPASPLPASKPTVSDVSFTPKLTGPTDALRSMTIVDFRRLSKDPKEATLKIKDKIDLLAEESFERKTEGIKAWQASESNKTYLSMLRTSLEGEPLVQVITKLQNTAQPVLTKEEFDAIMELNRDLRFG